MMLFFIKNGCWLQINELDLEIMRRSAVDWTCVFCYFPLLFNKICHSLAFCPVFGCVGCVAGFVTQVVACRTSLFFFLFQLRFERDEFEAKLLLQNWWKWRLICIYYFYKKLKFLRDVHTQAHWVFWLNLRIFVIFF